MRLEDERESSSVEDRRGGSIGRIGGLGVGTTLMPAEVCEYPDSKKIGAFGGGLRHMTRAQDGLDYWVDET